jgi:hypothetical protein
MQDGGMSDRPTHDEHQISASPAAQLAPPREPQLVEPDNLYLALQRSPLAAALREGLFGDPDADPFPRERDFARDEPLPTVD